MSGRLRQKYHNQKHAARREFHLSQMERPESGCDRAAPTGAFSHHVKVVAPDLRALIDAALAARGGRHD